MSKKYEELAKNVVELVGGKSNIISAFHCQTRLRFQLKDDSIAEKNKDKISSLDQVMQTLNQGGMFQVVVGMDVADAYEEVEKLIGITSDDTATIEKKKQNVFNTVTDFISSVFSPIIPALAGAGMVKALLALLTAFNWVDKSSQTYALINMFGDATFAFMPILLAYTTAEKLKCNKIMAAVTAGIMVHSSWATMVDAGTAVQFAGFIPMYLVKYTGSVIPIILVLLVQVPLEKWLNHHIPGSVRLVFAPMIEFIIMGVLALSILGPAGDYAGKFLTWMFTWLSEHAAWLELGLLGGLFPISVIFGLHHSYAQIGTIQMTQMGYDGVFGPAVVCANIGQGTASLVTGLLCKDNKTKQIGISAGVTGLMGTTEPALYGINLPKKYPLIAGCIGSAAGGLYAGIMHTHRFATGSSGLPAVVMYLGDGTLTHFINIMVALAITILVTSILTFIFFKKYEKKVTEPEYIDDTKLNEEVTDETINSPVSGSVLPMSQAADQMFSQEMMGKGAVVVPTEGKVYAPFDGKVVTLFPTFHAIGLKSPSGAEVLVHIGIDTVDMKGKGFNAFVKQGDSVSKGQLLIEFDQEEIKAAGHSDQVMVVITNTKDYSDVKEKNISSVKAGEKLIDLTA
jgi:PTS system beta-glucosides-specific IIC component